MCIQPVDALMIASLLFILAWFLWFIGVWILDWKMWHDHRKMDAFQQKAFDEGWKAREELGKHGERSVR